MENLHRVFWKVKGRMPAIVSIGFLLGIYALFILADFVPPPIGRPITTLLMLPLLYCLAMVYTYFAIAIPLLAVCYLGFLFADQYRALEPYALPSGILGAIALVLGIVSEIQHSQEKRTEISRRYGAKLPSWLAILVGCLGFAGGVREACSGTSDALDSAQLIAGSLMMVLVSMYVLITKRKRA